MAGRSDYLSPEEIANILDESFHDNEVCSDEEDGLEECDHDSVSKIFCDNSDDPNFVPCDQEDESDAHNSSGDDALLNKKDDEQPVDDGDGAVVRVAQRSVLGRRNINMTKRKKFCL